LHVLHSHLIFLSAATSSTLKGKDGDDACLEHDIAEAYADRTSLGSTSDSR
jgi:hypothetical protein